jgi:uncharacterized damage-inducible protein DinB
MKEVLKRFADYNLWANGQLFDCMRNLTDEQLNREIASSFSSIYKTVLHLWLAEEAWWQRLKLVENLQLESQEFTGNFSELEKKFSRQSAEWADWVNNATEAQLSHVFAYQNTKREQFKQPVNEVLMHLFNHGTYHRGQLVTLLRQLGVEKIPQSDYIVYCRKK